MANTILTPQMWVNVSLVDEKAVVNSRWQINYMMYNYIWCKMYEDHDNLYVILKHFEHISVYFSFYCPVCNLHMIHTNIRKFT